MRAGDLINKRPGGVSFEFFPPRTAAGRQGFMEVVHALERYDPLYVSVTCGAGGSTRERTSNTLSWIQQETALTKKLRDAMAPYLDSPGDMRKIGVDFAIEQCRDLLANGVRYFHFYTMNRSDTVSGIIDALEF